MSFLFVCSCVGAFGSGTGILLSTTIIYQHLEVFMKEQQKKQQMLKEQQKLEEQQKLNEKQELEEQQEMEEEQEIGLF